MIRTKLRIFEQYYIVKLYQIVAQFTFLRVSENKNVLQYCGFSLFSQLLHHYLIHPTVSCVALLNNYVTLPIDNGAPL
jgi:hypothetical protein